MATEKRLIDANDAEISLFALRKGYRHPHEKCAVGGCISLIRDLPTVDAVEVVHGRWEQLGEADYRCSRCGFRFTSADHITMFQYCRCGAKMDGGNEDEKMR